MMCIIDFQVVTWLPKWSAPGEVMGNTVDVGGLGEGEDSGETGNHWDTKTTSPTVTERIDMYP